MAVWKVESSREFESRRRLGARSETGFSLSKVHPLTDRGGDGPSSVKGPLPRSESKSVARYRPKWARNRPPVLSEQQKQQAEVDATPGLLVPMQVDVWKEPEQHNQFELRASMRTAYPPDLLYSIATDFDGAPRMFRDMAVCTSERLAASPGAAHESRQHPVMTALRLRSAVTAGQQGGVGAAGRGVDGESKSKGRTGGGNYSNENLVRLMRGIFGDGATCSSSNSSDGDSSEGERRVAVFKVRQSVRWRYLFLSGTLNSVVVATRDDANRCITFQLAEPGFMKGFEGVWAVIPIEIPRESAAFSASQPNMVTPSFASLSATRSVMPALSLARLPGVTRKTRERFPGRTSHLCQQQGSEMILHQRIVPFFLPPGPIGLMYGILGSQVRNLFHDVCVEAMKQQLETLKAPDEKMAESRRKVE